ncbi:MAG TPA: hypothetical protein VM327_08975, partial [Candidatus Thermoplasmatota archaeon]|nr:hypothetical protein [Candidatus Thermoplasmatota archaeon]
DQYQFPGTPFLGLGVSFHLRTEAGAAFFDERVAIAAPAGDLGTASIHQVSWAYAGVDLAAELDWPFKEEGKPEPLVGGCLERAQSTTCMSV